MASDAHDRPSARIDPKLDFDEDTWPGRRREVLDRLVRHVETWHCAGQMPPDLERASSSEFAAGCLAASRWDQLDDPLGSFLLLESWLQAWVLRRTGKTGAIGTVVGYAL